MVQKRYFKKLLKSIIVKNVFIMTNIWFELLFFPCLVTPLINFFNINMFPVWISSKSYTFSPFCWVKYVFKKKKKKMLPAGELSNFPLLGKDDDLDEESKLGPGELVKFSVFIFFRENSRKFQERWSSKSFKSYMRRILEVNPEGIGW